jgi:hypothetical protein
MANRYPLIVDTSDSNKIKEIPVGDNLNLSGCGIVNASSLSVTGAITAQSVTVNGTTLADVATTGDYNDLTNTPVAFSGSYNDLTNKPTIPTSTQTLSDVQPAQPNDGDVLQYNALNGRYEPLPMSATISLSTYNLDALQNVITTGDTTNKYLKYYSGAWRAANVTYGEVQNAPTKLSDLTNDLDLSDFANTPGYISSETDNQLLSFDGSLLSISDGNAIVINEMNVTGDLTGSVFADDSTVMVDSVNGLILGRVQSDVYALDGITLLVNATDGTITGPIVTTNITTNQVTLGVGGTINGGAGGISLNPDTGLSLEMYATNNQIIISNDPDTLQADSSIAINAGNAINITSQGSMSLSSSTGTTTIDATVLDVNSTGVVTIDGNGIELTSSSSQIQLNGTEVSIAAAVTLEGTSSLQVGNFTTTERGDLSAGYGMIIYNTSTNKFQGYYDNGSGGAWVDLH